MTEEFKNITPEELDKVISENVTLLDLREPDELVIDSIEGSLNIPFSQISRLGEVPKDKPVYVFCRVGDYSEEVAEILTDRGYEVYNVEGGYNAYKEYKKNKKPETVSINAKGLMCPGPIVKVADTIRGLKDGDRVHVEATEDAFFSDIRIWCERTGNVLLDLEKGKGIIIADIEKRTVSEDNSGPNQIIRSGGDDKTFIIFDNDLDKTIAAFIIANGAAAMGRKVTMFFTFWGLNILRKPKKVKVKKTFIESMFGFMMPRGTKKLKLSQMNMGGAGAKMIRTIMKRKGVSSVEELIQSAIDHGVKIVACQMSMDIMGIKKEELIDGVDLGGVSTFLGSAELSDTSLFI